MTDDDMREYARACVLADRAARVPQQPAQVDIKALAKRAKLPKYMYDTEGGCDALSRLVAIATQPSRVQLLVEQLAQQWDGCMWEGPGGDIDIGEAIRAAGRRLLGDSVLPATQPMPASGASGSHNAAAESPKTESRTWRDGVR
jgi:hypothetical protein